MSGYIDRPQYEFFSDLLDEAIQTARTHSVLINEPSNFSVVERAAISLAPSSLSIASSIRLLIKEGYTPSARILLRPMLERVGTLDFVVNDQKGSAIWKAGWKKKDRPSLSALLSRLDHDRNSPNDFQKWVIDDLNSVIHPDPVGLDSLRSPTLAGTKAHWFDRHPEDFTTADMVCSVGAMCSVFISSNLRRAFRDRVADWSPPN